MSDDRPIRYIDQGKVIYRASGVGGCVRSMVAAAQGAERKPHPQWFQEVLDEGTRLEAAISAMVEEQSGVPTTASQKEVELFIGHIDGHDVYVRGHIDGEGFDSSILREFKKIRESGWQNFLRQGVEVHANYPWQVSVMMHAGSYDSVEFTGGRCVDGEIVEVYCHYLDAPPIPLKDIKQKIAKVERLINEGYGPDEVECSGHFPCPYWYLHDVKEGMAEVELTPAMRLIIDNKRAASARQKELEQDLQGVKEYKKALDQELTQLALPDKFATLVDGVQVKVSRTKRTVAERTTVTKSYELDYWQVK